METTKKTVQGVWNATGKAHSLMSWCQSNARYVADTIRVYGQRHPPLAAYLLTLFALSSIPLTIFLIFSMSSAFVFLSIAFIGFSMAEGTMLAIGSGILLFVVGGIGLFTSIAFFWIALAWYSFKGFRYAFSKVNQGVSQVATNVKQGQPLYSMREEQ
jgi:hypothetical protein